MPNIRADMAAFERATLNLPPRTNTQPDASPPAPSLTPRADRWRERHSPVAERLAEALKSVPPEVLADGIALREVWPMVLGRQRSKPTQGAIGDALRELGFERRRVYSEGTRPTQSLWFKPDTKTKDSSK